MELLTMATNEARVAAARTRISQAVIRCLDEVGYSETSMNRVQSLAGVSRGAITHHFPTKQVLVAETALRMLDSALNPRRRNRDNGEDEAFPNFGDFLHRSWNDVVNTPEGRALLEILLACRTDPELHAALSDGLYAWDEASNAVFRSHYLAKDDPGGQTDLLWGICRAFMRGLLVSEQFVSDREQISRMLALFARIMADQVSKLPASMRAA